MAHAPRELTEAEVAELEKIGFEPDNVPTRLLVNVAIALTVAVIGSVIFADFLFKSTVAAELAAKGYTVESDAVYDLEASK